MNRSQYFQRHREAEPRSWYRIRNEVDAESGASVAQIDLYDEIDPIWGVSAQQFVADLRRLDAGEIQLHVNSPGGSVYDGIAIMNALRQHDAKVVATIDGLAASAAGFLAIGAADELVMAENSELMIHNAWGVVVGDADDMAKVADDLRRINTNVASIYHGKAGGEVDDWLDAMRAETWYSAHEAVKAGLADRILKTKKAEKPEAKAAWVSAFNYAGRAAAPAPRTASARAEVNPRREERPVAALDDGLRTLLGVGADVDDAGLIEKVKALRAERDEALEEATKPQTAPAAKLPDGVVAVDAVVFADLKAKVERHEATAERQQAQERERVLMSFLQAGTITPASRDQWDKQLEKDFEGTCGLLASLQPGTVPVVGTEIGHAGEPDMSAALDAELSAVFAGVTGTEWKV